jgi:hypothetical protein
MGDDYIFERVKQAFQKARQVPPDELFESLVKRGAIDEQGNVLLRIPMWECRPGAARNGAQPKAEQHREPEAESSSSDADPPANS